VDKEKFKLRGAEDQKSWQMVMVTCGAQKQRNGKVFEGSAPKRQIEDLESGARSCGHPQNNLLKEEKNMQAT